MSPQSERNIPEAILVQRMVVAQWQLLHIWGFERLALLTAPENDSEDPATRCYTNFLGLQTQSRAGNAFQVSAQRYQRQFDQALAQLERFRGSVNFLPNPISDSKQSVGSENPEPTPNPGNPETSPPPPHAAPAAEADSSDSGVQSGRAAQRDSLLVGPPDTETGISGVGSG